MSGGGKTPGPSLAVAAAAAQEAGVPVSTIACGPPQGTVINQDAGATIRVPVDEASLQALADNTGGTYYRATTGEQLRAVYADIGSSVGYQTEQRTLTQWCIAAA